MAALVLLIGGGALARHRRRS
ncbi:hypothetical protein [Microbacterium sp. PMB16]